MALLFIYGKDQLLFLYRMTSWCNLISTQLYILLDYSVLQCIKFCLVKLSSLETCVSNIPRTRYGLKVHLRTTQEVKLALLIRRSYFAAIFLQNFINLRTLAEFICILCVYFFMIQQKDLFLYIFCSYFMHSCALHVSETETHDIICARYFKRAPVTVMYSFDFISVDPFRHAFVHCACKCYDLY